MVRLFSRIARLWKLSAFEPASLEEILTDGKNIRKAKQEIKVLINPSARFIPRIKVDPIKQITEEHVD